MDVAANGSPDPALSPPKLGPREPDSIPHSMARSGSTSSADNTDSRQQRQPQLLRLQPTGHDKKWQEWREWLMTPCLAGLKTWQLLLLAVLPFLPAITIALAASLPILFIGVAAVALTGFAMTPMLVLAAVLFLAFFPAQRRWLLQLVQRVAASLHLLRPLPHGQQQQLQPSQPVKHAEKPRGEGRDLAAEQQPVRSPTVDPARSASYAAGEAGKPVENGSSGRVVVTSSPRVRNGPAVASTSPSVAVSSHPAVAPAEMGKAKVAGAGSPGGKMGEGVRAPGKTAFAAERHGSPKAVAARAALSPSRGKSEGAGKGSGEGESPAKLKEDKREAGNANKAVAQVEHSVTGKAGEGVHQPGTAGSGNGSATGGKKSGATKGQAKGQGKIKGKNKRG
ncbi:hypothetical protein CLOM_g4056 [Closterium sp. NIES-68]|nr:hypothetical protein CLOM_g4056 [Closterium sp. NIES-68]GJP57909.1 hypothetical protein CLOP_g18124 [Closterium sp. NIES-67]